MFIVLSVSWHNCEEPAASSSPKAYYPFTYLKMTAKPGLVWAVLRVCPAADPGQEVGWGWFLGRTIWPLLHGCSGRQRHMRQGPGHAPCKRYLAPWSYKGSREIYFVDAHCPCDMVLSTLKIITALYWHNEYNSFDSEDGKALWVPEEGNSPISVSVKWQRLNSPQLLSLQQSVIQKGKGIAVGNALHKITVHTYNILPYQKHTWTGPCHWKSPAWARGWRGRDPHPEWNSSSALSHKSTFHTSPGLCWWGQTGRSSPTVPEYTSFGVRARWLPVLGHLDKPTE